MADQNWTLLIKLNEPQAATFKKMQDALPWSHHAENVHRLISVRKQASAA